MAENIDDESNHSSSNYYSHSIINDEGTPTETTADETTDNVAPAHGEALDGNPLAIDDTVSIVDSTASSLDGNNLQREDLGTADEPGLSFHEMQDSEAVRKLALLMSSRTSIFKKSNYERPKPEHFVVKKEVVQLEAYGLDIDTLRSWQIDQSKGVLDMEDTRQEYALARMKGFMMAVILIVRIQSWWRMLRIKEKFAAWRAERKAVRRHVFRSWKQYFLSEKMRTKIICGKPFDAWAQDVCACALICLLPFSQNYSFDLILFPLICR